MDAYIGEEQAGRKSAAGTVDYLQDLLHQHIQFRKILSPCSDLHLSDKAHSAASKMPIVLFCRTKQSNFRTNWKVTVKTDR